MSIEIPRLPYQRFFDKSTFHHFPLQYYRALWLLKLTSRDTRSHILLSSISYLVRQRRKMKDISPIFIFLVNFLMLVDMFCVYLITQFLRKKPLGMQTLMDLMTTNTLFVQSTDIIAHSMLYNWSVLASSLGWVKMAMENYGLFR